ncbi:MAG: transposase [Syntrophorhabdus aromaticivorans]|uniref:Transposase n=1 Tax=Syntrophorhabdus aromaticivorans TaxID=328301 RepID=A0A971S0V6_9BACT|nr:transposase [Syntrophorhabdus aromaticivorans]
MRRCSTGFSANARPSHQRKRSSASRTSSIELCTSLFDRATYRQTKGAVKLHLLLDHGGCLPVFARITKGSIHELNVGRGLSLPRVSIVAIDRGYADYTLFARWNTEGVFFVTRHKRGTDYTIVEERTIPRNRNILNDQIIVLNNCYVQKHSPCRLRRIKVWLVPSMQRRHGDAVGGHIKTAGFTAPSFTLVLAINSSWEWNFWLRCPPVDSTNVKLRPPVFLHEVQSRASLCGGQS